MAQDDSFPAGAAIREIRELARQQPFVAVHKPPAEPEGRYLIVKPSGEYEWRDARPSSVKIECADPSEVYSAAIRSGVLDLDVSSYDRAGNEITALRVFLGESGLLCVMGWSDNFNSDQYRCPFKKSPPMLALERPQALEQDAFVRFLRIDLAGAIDKSILGLVRNVRWSKTETAGGSVDQMKQDHSLGRSVELQVTGADKLPDATPVEIKVFDAEWAVPFRIECALEVLHNDRKFRLTPFPGQLSAAIKKQIDLVAEACPEEIKPHLYRGSVSGG